MSDNQLESALNLMRRMPPSSIENNLAGLIELLPNHVDDLLNHIDQPLKIKKDQQTGQEYILCDYNRDGDSYRSPWSNRYYPAIDDGFLPSSSLRSLEIEANKLFDIYRKMYFEGGYSSCYFFETNNDNDNNNNSIDHGFGCCYLIHKDIHTDNNNNNNNNDNKLQKGWWDSIHVIEVVQDNNNNKVYNYKLTTTVMVSMSLANNNTIGDVDLSGSMTKQDSRRGNINDHHHLHHIGQLIEDVETRIRNEIEGIYIQKTREIINGMRSTSIAKEQQWQQLTQSLNQAVNNHANK